MVVVVGQLPVFLLIKKPAGECKIQPDIGLRSLGVPVSQFAYKGVSTSLS